MGEEEKWIWESTGLRMRSEVLSAVTMGVVIMNSTFGGAWRLANWLSFHHPMNVTLRSSFRVVTSCCLQKVTVISTGRSAYILSVENTNSTIIGNFCKNVSGYMASQPPKKIILQEENVVTFVIFYIRAFGTVPDFDVIFTWTLLFRLYLAFIWWKRDRMWGHELESSGSGTQ